MVLHITVSSYFIYVILSQEFEKVVHDSSPKNERLLSLITYNINNTTQTVNLCFARHSLLNSMYSFYTFEHQKNEKKTNTVNTYTGTVEYSILSILFNRAG